MSKEEFKQFCIMQANWWTASAINGHCLNSNITKSVGYEEDVQLTDQEKVKDAMDTARNHMQNYWEACNE